MYIAIYVSAIVLICVGAITFFVVKDKKNKKRGEILKQIAREDSDENASLQEKKDARGERPEEKVQEQDAQNQQDGLEDISIEIEDKPKKSGNNFDLNPFSLDGTLPNNGASNNFDDLTAEDTQENLDETAYDEDEDDLDKKFKEYEEFLKRNLDLDDDDLEVDGGENEEDDFDDIDFDDESVGSPNLRFPIQNEMEMSDEELAALRNFDYDSLKGKNEEEIAEIIKNLPPKAQEILMGDILARRKYDDED